MLGWLDVRQAYSRSIVGPFWITIGMAIQIGAMGLVFGTIFKTALGTYLPFLTVSIVVWGLISTTINEGCTSLTSSEAMIKQLNLPHFQYMVRTVWRNLVTASHNLLIVPVVLIIFSKTPGLPLIGFAPGVVLLVLNLAWVVWLLGMLGARYRDMPPIINSVVTIAFYVTPIMWYPKLIANDSLAHLLLGLNPLYHWVQIVRLPILGQWPTLENWGLALLSAGVGWAITLLAHKKFKNMIAYWV